MFIIQGHIEPQQDHHVITRNWALFKPDTAAAQRALETETSRLVAVLKAKRQVRA